jgi:hypothetical protein
MNIIILMLLFAVVVFMLAIHKMLHKDFPSYASTYRKMINDNPRHIFVPLLGDLWNFNDEEIGILIPDDDQGMSIFMLENNKVIVDKWPWYCHPYSLYWLLKYKSHLKKLKKL